MKKMKNKDKTTLEQIKEQLRLLDILFSVADEDTIEDDNGGNK